MSMTKEQVQEMLFGAALAAHQYFSQQVELDEDTNEIIEAVEPSTPIEAPSIPPSEIIKPALNADDYSDLQDALDYAGSIGGAVINFGEGDYFGNIYARHTGIELRGAGADKTTLRPKTSSSVVHVEQGALGFVLDGMHVSGQTLADLQVPTDGARKINTTALHCIIIREKGARLSNFKTSGARYDGLNFYYDGDLDFAAENFLIDDTGRNPVSIINGQKFMFKHGHIRLSGKCAAQHDSHLNAGVYLFDAEPNNSNKLDPTNKNETWRTIKCIDVHFEANGGGSGAHQIVLQDTNIDTRNDVDTHFIDCKFSKGPNGDKSAYVRLKADYGDYQFENLHFYNCEFDGRVVKTSNSQKIRLTDSTFNKILLNVERSFSWEILLGKNTVVNDVTHIDGLDIGSVVYDKATNAVITNVTGITDIS